MSNNDKITMTVHEVARCLGCRDETIHTGIISGNLPFGLAIKMPSGRYKYIIPREAFEKWCADPRKDLKPRDRRD